MLRVMRCKVKANGNIYTVGETLPQLSVDDENRLLKSGIAEEIMVEPAKIELEKPSKKAKKHVDEDIKEESDDNNSDNEVEETPETDVEDVNIDLNLDDVVVDEDKKSKNKSRK